MKARMLCVAILLGAVTGCTDTAADSISREYCNQINEGLDAMAFVNDEASAEQMTTRVFKPMAARFKEIDRRLRSVRVNPKKEEVAIEFTTSPGANRYVSEVFLNRDRYRQELERINAVAKRAIEAERARHAQAGGQPFNPADVCKALQAVKSDGVLAPLNAQVNETPAIFALLNEMSGWKLKQEILDEMNVQRKRFNIPLGELK